MRCFVAKSGLSRFTRSSIAFEELLRSLIAPQVLLVWLAPYFCCLSQHTNTIQKQNKYNINTEKIQYKQRTNTVIGWYGEIFISPILPLVTRNFFSRLEICLQKNTSSGCMIGHNVKILIPDLCNPIDVKLNFKPSFISGTNVETPFKCDNVSKTQLRPVNGWLMCMVIWIQLWNKHILK